MRSPQALTYTPGHFLELKTIQTHPPEAYVAQAPFAPALTATKVPPATTLAIHQLVKEWNSKARRMGCVSAADFICQRLPGFSPHRLSWIDPNHSNWYDGGHRPYILTEHVIATNGQVALDLVPQLALPAEY